jgi:hypothetical protein
MAKDDLQDSVLKSSKGKAPIEEVSEDKVQHDLVSVEVHTTNCLHGFNEPLARVTLGQKEVTY